MPIPIRSTVPPNAREAANERLFFYAQKRHQGIPDAPIRAGKMKRRVDMRQAAEPLEATYSTAEVMAHLGIKRRKLDELLSLGRTFGRALHPTKGGLHPCFRVSHKNVRVTATAIEAHKRHMERLDVDAMFAAEQKARARALGEQEAA